MRLFLPLLYCCLALFITCGTALSVSRPQTVLIGLDLSASNPLIKDDNYAARVGARVALELQALPLKSRVLVRTFGNYDTASNTLKIDQMITTTAKPQNVAVAIATLISNLPKLVREKKLSVQGRTNIVPFLETMSEVINCKSSNVKVILATDGFEDSDYARLSRYGGKLPLPASKLYPGCKEMLMLGIGSSAKSPATTKRLQDQWALWAAAAGFKKFTGLYDW